MNVPQQYLYMCQFCLFFEMINSLFEYDSENFNKYGSVLKSSCGDNKDRENSDIN
jgi:hypothetical protein